MVWWKERVLTRCDRMQAKRAFCAVRPPGHHAGPTGIVSNVNEAAGSHGFCILNNVSIGAAYALSMYRCATCTANKSQCLLAFCTLFLNL